MNEKTYVPNSVAIVALGPSMHEYVSLSRTSGSRKAIADETWAINAVIDVIQYDRGFAMDDLRVQEARAAADPAGHVANLLAGLKAAKGPVYTSTAYPEYPAMVEYPLEDVLNKCGGFLYFNSTVAYAVAYALYLGVPNISLWGIDFTYSDRHHAEKGRACVEYWLGQCAAVGAKILVPNSSTLLDGSEPEDQKPYGYDAHKIVVEDLGDKCKIKKIPRENLPSAAEMEKRYDHGDQPKLEVVA